jgi:hypothetical protein
VNEALGVVSQERLEEYRQLIRQLDEDILVGIVMNLKASKSVIQTDLIRRQHTVLRWLSREKTSLRPYLRVRRMSAQHIWAIKIHIGILDWGLFSKPLMIQSR